MTLGENLLRARTEIGYDQEDAAEALGVSRAMISYWETGKRTPNDRQVASLARLFHVPVAQIYASERFERRDEQASVLLRAATDEIPAAGAAGIREFSDWLDSYAELAERAGATLHPMTQSPFMGHDLHERDARRKAEEVRAHLRLGLGPIGDIDWVCELLGISVYRSALGTNLQQTISGAFFNHPRVGFSILVNLEMTPGRRRFTIAHELGHALFHSDRSVVVSGPTKDRREKFADAFAGELLMPEEGIRRVLEEMAAGPRLKDPVQVIHLQRFFKVSYATALVRLRQAKMITRTQYDEFKYIQPVVLAASMGYEVDDEEYEQDPTSWRTRRFPTAFINLVRQAIQSGVISVPTAASLTGLTIDETAALLEVSRRDTPPDEFGEFEDSGVAA